MGLLDVVVLSAVQGAAEALPISSTGHGAAARLWFRPDGDAGPDAGQAVGRALAGEGVLCLAIAVALALATRRRLAAALGEGVRAIVRSVLLRTLPGAQDAALVLAGSVASAVAAALLRPYAEAWSQAAIDVGRGAAFAGPSIYVGAGLICTGAILASAWLIPAPAARPGAPGLPAMLAVGLVHGLAIAPGASRIGTALVLLLWLGVKPGRAIDLAFLLTVPSLIVAGARGLGAIAPGGAHVAVAGVLVAFLSASLAAAGLRWLVARRRVGLLALWVVPLGLATVAYARAL